MENNSRTLNNPGYLGASASYGNGNGTGNESEYVYSREAYEDNSLQLRTPDYNHLERPQYNSLGSRRSSGEYGFAASRPVSVHSYAGINYYEGEGIKQLGLVLPPGWFESLDNDTGKLFYSHEPTKTTQWLHPGIPVGTIMPNGIPYGWDTTFDRKTGKRYWINHIKGYNTWEMPDFTEELKKLQH